MLHAHCMLAKEMPKNNLKSITIHNWHQQSDNKSLHCIDIEENLHRKDQRNNNKYQARQQRSLVGKGKRLRTEMSINIAAYGFVM